MFCSSRPVKKPTFRAIFTLGLQYKHILCQPYVTPFIRDTMKSVDFIFDPFY